MSLIVVTQTRFTRPEWLEQCKESVAAALPPGAVHLILNSPSEHWSTLRHEATQASEFVAFVDDDDIIDPLSLKLLLKALQTSNAGMACTNESTADIDLKNIKPMPDVPKIYERIRTQPRELHHLRMYRASAIDKTSLDLNNEIGCGIDGL